MEGAQSALNPCLLFREYERCKKKKKNNNNNFVTHCLPCHTRRQFFGSSSFCFSSLPWDGVIPAIIHGHASRLTFSHRPAFVSTVWWIFAAFYSEADTAGQAGTNWSREKQISVSQSGSPTLLAFTTCVQPAQPGQISGNLRDPGRWMGNHV